MADRVKSTDGSRDTDEVRGRDDRIDQQGSAGGDLARGEGKADELKRTFERPAGRTRVTSGDKHGGSTRTRGTKED